MTQGVPQFCEWLAATPASSLIKTVEWIIPAVQTIHILSIAIVMSSVSMIDLQVLGIIPRSEPLAAVAQRFLPWIWWTLVLLLISGSTLIIGEPGRSLGNPAFVLKMSMLCTVLILTLVFQRGLRSDSQFWDRSRSRRASSRVIAAVSLVLWVGIIFAGRWIAYIDLDAN